MFVRSLRCQSFVAVNKISKKTSDMKRELNSSCDLFMKNVTKHDVSFVEKCTFCPAGFLAKT